MKKYWHLLITHINEWSYKAPYACVGMNGEIPSGQRGFRLCSAE